MELQRAIKMIQTAIPSEVGQWADLGAGTGLFTLALDQLLPEGSKVFAVDKSPHALYKLPKLHQVQLEIVDANFERILPLPQMDGIIMANALHYVQNKPQILAQILGHLRPQGRFILIEYDIKTPVSTWIPYPIDFEAFHALAPKVGLSTPELIDRVPSIYGHQSIYAAVSLKIES